LVKNTILGGFIMGLPTVALENGEIIAYRHRPGTGDKTIVLIHGNMTSSLHWDTVMEALDEKYTIYAVDLRGFGESSYSREIERIEDFSHDVEEWMAKLDLRNIALVGWSTGGAVAMDMCIDDTEHRIEKCILVASASTRGYPFFLQAQQRIAETKEEIIHDPFVTVPVETMQRMKNYAGIQAVWEQLIYTHYKSDHDHYGKYLRDICTQQNLGDVYYALHTFDITDEIDEIQMPMLIIYGDRDYVVSEKMTQEIITDFGGKAKVLKIKDCGHSPMVDQLNILTTAIQKFIN